MNCDINNNFNNNDDSIRPQTQLTSPSLPVSMAGVLLQYAVLRTALKRFPLPSISAVFLISMDC